MEATGNCTIVICTTQEARQLVNSITDAVCESYVSCFVVAQPLVMPHVRHAHVLLPLVMHPIRHAHLNIHIVVSLKGRTTCIWSFGCGFAGATTMGCTGFELSFGIVIVL